MTYVHIHAPKATAKRLVKSVCPDCGKQTRFVEFFTPWYGWDTTCLRCGRQWKDGEWMRLEFYRFARQDNIKMARGYWRSMPPVSQNHWGLEPHAPDVNQESIR